LEEELALDFPIGLCYTFLWTAVVKLRVKSRQQVSMALVEPYKRQLHQNQPFVRFMAGRHDDLLQQS
jgi:hypothetical protein